MRILTIMFLLITFASCSIKQGDTSTEEAIKKKVLSLPKISVIDTDFPLILKDIDFQNMKTNLHVDDGITSRIEQVIIDFYFNDCSGDSSETYFSVKDTYYNTIYIHDSLQSIYLVLLNHFPTGKVNSKIIFYQNDTKEFIDNTLDFNIHALYVYNNNKLEPTNLKVNFKINTPEIVLVDFDNDRVNEFMFTGLFHSGTANAIETTIIKILTNEIDTLYFNQKWIGPGTEKPKIMSPDIRNTNTSK